jgi:hypothetical protein
LGIARLIADSGLTMEDSLMISDWAPVLNRQSAIKSPLGNNSTINNYQSTMSLPITNPKSKIQQR